jgi:ankyrin repeat protein
VTVRTLSRLAAVGSLLALSFAASGSPDLDAKLLAAAQKPNAADVRALLASGADANARAADGSTALIYAAHFGDVASVQALLGAKGDPNLANRYGIGAMHEAALRADAGLLKVLLDAGADVDLALPRGANVNVVERWQGETPLMYAAAHDRGDVAAALIAAGADVNARTPLTDLPDRKPAVRYFV